MSRDQVIREWLQRTRTTVESRRTVQEVKPLLWNNYLRLSADKLDSTLTATESISYREMPALQITITEEELERLILDQEKLRKLMYLTEVREAIMYYTLNGYLDNGTTY
jgi:hypothetical protein